MAVSDVDQVLGGPADFQLAATSLGHTSGGITATITPEQKEVNVDKFGNSACNVRHIGDSVHVVVPLAEVVDKQFAEVYAAGKDETEAGGAKYMGIGRASGFIHTTLAALIIPLLTADVAKRLSFLRVTPVGEIQIGFNSEDDRILETDFLCCVDESATDGELIGKIELTQS